MKSYFIALVLLAAVFIIPLTQARKSTTFMLEVKSNSNSIDYYQTKSHWQLMKGDQTCRGFYLPRPRSAWKCSEENNQTACSREFECVLSNKNYNRKNEIARLGNQLKKMRPQSSQVVASVKTEKLLNVEKSKPRPKKVEVVETRSTSKKIVPVKKVTSLEQKRELDEFQDFSEKEDMKQMESIKLEPKYVVQQDRSLDGRTTVFKVRPKEDKDIIDEGRQPFLPLSFAGSMTKISDQTANSLSTTDVAWTPRYRFKNSWGMRGHAGGHFIKATVDDVSETFLVMDFALYAEFFLTDNIYLDGGMGIQKWNSTTGGAFSTMGFGGGYQFDFHQIKIVDRIFVSYNSVGNEEKNKELKVGIGLSF